jgi:hypothetical protein
MAGRATTRSRSAGQTQHPLWQELSSDRWGLRKQANGHFQGQQPDAKKPESVAGAAASLTTRNSSVAARISAFLLLIVGAARKRGRRERRCEQCRNGQEGEKGFHFSSPFCFRRMVCAMVHTWWRRARRIMGGAGKTLFTLRELRRSAANEDGVIRYSKFAGRLRASRAISRQVSTWT